MKDTISGGCFCGEVTFEVKNEFRHFFFCHCEQCRQITGSAHASNLFGGADALTFTAGQDNVEVFRHPTRSLAKAFCKTCGAGLPYKNSRGTMTIIPAGSLSEMPDVSNAKRIFWDDRAEWHDMIDEAPKFSEFPT